MVSVIQDKVRVVACVTKTECTLTTADLEEGVHFSWYCIKCCVIINTLKAFIIGIVDFRVTKD